MSDNQFLTVNEVARIYNKSVQTVYRNIKAGKISRESSGLISLSECLRAYGSMPNQNAIPEINNMALLERQAGVVSPAEKSGGLFGKLFK